jgi:hypothetical protein
VAGVQEQFVVVTAPAGVVIVSSLPADFEVVELNTLYFRAGGRFYVPYHSPVGKELFVAVDTPPRVPRPRRDVPRPMAPQHQGARGHALIVRWAPRSQRAPVRRFQGF